ncbi:MAG TPA: DegV family protein [Chloroflexota bacterium]|nr:DegV family protein [Chloroflexota bacterium]
MGEIRIVTDSASDIPAALAEALRIVVVPLSVQFGPKNYREREELTSTQFYDMLAKNPNFPRTSQPSVGNFEEVYRELAGQGAEIISIHLSSKLSGTFNAASLAAANVPEARVHLVDTLTASMAEGVYALAAARMAADGQPAAAILTAIEALRSRVFVIFMLDSMTHVQRGGRIGRAQSMIGALLNIKPLLIIEDGLVTPRQRTRTTARALREMANLAEERAPLAEAHVMHANAPQVAQELAALLQPYVRGTLDIDVLGAVIGTHAGAGTIGFVGVQAEGEGRS